MEQKQLNRDEILSTLQNACEPLDWVHAMWQGGAAAFNRVDEWSDIDLQLNVDDDRIEDAFELVEKTLATLSPVDLKYRIPEPTWHGFSQMFYRLRDASKYLLIDLSI